MNRQVLRFDGFTSLPNLLSLTVTIYLLGAYFRWFPINADMVVVSGLGWLAQIGALLLVTSVAAVRASSPEGIRLTKMDVVLTLLSISGFVSQFFLLRWASTIR